MEENNTTENKLIAYLKRNVSRANLIGMIAGAVVSFIYYRNVSCSSGNCNLTSNPFLMITWGIAVGYIAGDFFNKKKS